AQMPKGGVLRNHLSGADYAESYIQYAAEDGLCIDRPSLTFTQPPCDESKSQVNAARALQDAVLYRDLIDAMSMRDFKPAAQSGHDHFFDTFGRSRIPSRAHTADVRRRTEDRRVRARGAVHLRGLSRLPTGTGVRAGAYRLRDGAG